MAFATQWLLLTIRSRSAAGFQLRAISGMTGRKAR
jgi:hypothetical protein